MILRFPAAGRCRSSGLIFNLAIRILSPVRSGIIWLPSKFTSTDCALPSWHSGISISMISSGDEIIQRHDVGTQEELAERLKGEGFAVTQATVSRDIREMTRDTAHDLRESQSIQGCRHQKRIQDQRGNGDCQTGEGTGGASHRYPRPARAPVPVTQGKASGDSGRLRQT